MPKGDEPTATAITWKEPSQARSRQRFSAILDAAGSLLDEGGMDLFTMDNIARRASTSMGSLYHFFPDRESLLQALTAHIHKELHARFNQLARPANVELEPEAMIGKVFDALLELIDQQPGTRSVITLAHSVPAILQARQPYAKSFVDSAQTYLKNRYPGLGDARRQTAADIFVYMGESLTILVSRVSGDRRKSFIREARKSLAAYMNTLE